MKVCIVAVCWLLPFVICGCSSVSGKKIVASSVDDFEKEAMKLCPYGYDVLGKPQVFIEGRENSRIIRCRMMR